jgi:CBS domain-containing protein
MPTVQEVMTTDPVALDASETVGEAARTMKAEDIGDVIVVRDGQICGVVTDRDIVVRVLAEGRDPNETQLSEVCSREVATVSPDDDLTAAGDLMRDRAVRRVPVVENGKPVGIVSIGDLAIERDPDSALSHISAAPPS